MLFPTRTRTHMPPPRAQDGLASAERATGVVAAAAPLPAQRVRKPSAKAADAAAPKQQVCVQICPSLIVVYS